MGTVYTVVNTSGDTSLFGNQQALSQQYTSEMSHTAAKHIARLSRKSWFSQIKSVLNEKKNCNFSMILGGQLSNMK